MEEKNDKQFTKSSNCRKNNVSGRYMGWDSIAVDQAVLSLTIEQKTELDRRLDAYESDGIKGRIADNVIAEIRKKL